MSRPRVILRCPACQCYADQIYHRKRDQWHCGFCRQWYAVQPVLPVLVAHVCGGDDDCDDDCDDESDDEDDICGEFALGPAPFAAVPRRR